MNLKKTKWIIALTFIVIGLFIVLTTSLPQSTQYYVTVEEFIQRFPELETQVVKVAGKVQAGSIVKENENLNWKFITEFNHHAIPVVYTGAMPDTFKEGADVVLTGKMNESHVFVAKEVLAKCASRYEEKLEPKLKT